MFNRCSKDIFGYCDGTPDWEVEPNKYTVNNVELTSGGKCKNDSKTCEKFLSAKELNQQENKSIV
jgi:hypothetical protein